ncbi:hypothetical protein [Streptomyces decoyicus]|uniref:hypothetical protein n=1 Tax=Streptomyces decoyicus TaxID=249567 RepID=UPI0038131CEF
MNGQEAPLCWSALTIGVHWVDTRAMVFVRLGAFAIREALRCVAEDREPQLIETRGSALS